MNAMMFRQCLAMTMNFVPTCHVSAACWDQMFSTAGAAAVMGAKPLKP